MTKTEARKRAHQVLVWGYFSPSPDTVYTFCPECHERVIHTDWVGRLMTESKRIAAAKEALVQHLLSAH